MKSVIRTFLAFILVVGVAPTQAAVIDLFEYGVNIDGVVAIPPVDPLPSAVDISAFNTTTGLGILTATVSGAGAHYVGGYFDHEIVEVGNTFFNETGAATGTPAAGQSWEIDEPGFGSTSFGTSGTILYVGDIFDNFDNFPAPAGTLDNQIFFDAFDSQSLLTPDDVSMAMAFDFTLVAGQQAVIDFVISDVAPPPGFYLSQFDPVSSITIYLSSTLAISAIAVPEPGTLLLLGLALLAVSVAHRRAGAGRRA